MIAAWGSGPSYDVRADIVLDGVVDFTDLLAIFSHNGETLGRGGLSVIGNRKGYAGYEYAPEIASNRPTWHVRHRVLASDLGRWTRRDPAGTVDGPTVYAYVASNPIPKLDPSGLIICDPCPGEGSYCTPDDYNCCIIWKHTKDVSAGTFCCRRRLITCVNDEQIDNSYVGSNWPSVGSAVTECASKCEPGHCANYMCRVDTGDPTLRPGKSRACSECGVYGCKISCLIEKCEGSRNNCSLCNGDQMCEEAVTRYFDIVEEERDEWCDECFPGESDDPFPEC